MGGSKSSAAPVTPRETVDADTYAPPAAEDPVNKQLGIERPASTQPLLGQSKIKSTPLIG